MKQLVEEWSYIPQDAFLFFPNEDEILVGGGEKQWRKIFQGGQQFTPFENKVLNELQQELVKQKLIIDPWFDRENRLRFLQANKFKISKTIQSMKQTTKWRKSSFPVELTPAVLKHLVYLKLSKIAGALYFCGRDNQYRPIIVADIGKFKADDDEDDSIPGALVIMMEFMINNLLIEGQVENYVLVMNLQAASFSYRNVIMKILSFTSNAYRGRLFVSYILSMPTVIRWGWDAIVSKFVSENTLKKIKISGDPYNEDMWTHISKNTIQNQYGGYMPALQGDFWPPNKDRLLFVQPQPSQQNRLISPQQYRQLFLQNRLINRKISLTLVGDLLQNKRNHQTQRQQPNKSSQKPKVDDDHTIPIRTSHLKQPVYPDDISIKVETPFVCPFKVIKTFFQTDSFRRICQSAS